MLVTGPGSGSPRVLSGDMVQDEVEHEADAGLVQGLGEAAQVVEGAEIGAHRPVVGHRIATVAVAVARAQ